MKSKHKSSHRFRMMPPDDYATAVWSINRICRLILLYPASTLGSIKNKAATLARIIDRME
jgi:hypothetical protein